MGVDVDSVETREWLDAIDSVIKVEGVDRAQFLIDCIAERARARVPAGGGNTPYVNTIEKDLPYPGDLTTEYHLRTIIRWNAIMIVLRGGKRAPELGGHIASYASAAVLYETGFNYFFRDRRDDFLGDLVFIQGHSSPGIYARAFLEGRLTEKQLDNFRQEVDGIGISSYPHPWLMPDFWQFPTVSMGLGPIQAIYQARYLKYLQHRGFVDNKDRKVWMFCGDGEMDEPESLGALSIAARERLDNLIFVVNCNLQRLDGPVRGNGKVIQEFERIFSGNGWNVIKIVWGREWDPILKKDTQGILKARLDEILDGEYQNFAAKDGAYIREHLFNTPELKALVKDLSDDDLLAMRRGGLDPVKVYTAYKQASETTDLPTVILAKTVKGFGMGAAGEAANTTHQQKKMGPDDLSALVKRFDLPLSEKQIETLSYLTPKKDSAEIKYLHERRDALGGFIPRRHSDAPKLTAPKLEDLKSITDSSGDREISTTMAFVRILNHLLKDKNIGNHITPIVPDESRTFGMEGLFRQIGIYNPDGQLYEPVDKAQLMFYSEKKDGQLLQEGINEAGAFCSWIAAATSYSVSGVPMIPFYIYYSMFGFQRVHDLAWAAGDSRARGFLLGATAGKTTLAGEGLQHTDSHSHIFSSVIPNCISYDPTFAYELAVIIQDGIKRMYQNQEDVFYYITLMNENYHHPELPKDAIEGILKGLYLFKEGNKKLKHAVQLMGSGTILREAIEAAEILENDFNVAAHVWSTTSFTELRRDGLEVERHNTLFPTKKPKTAYVTDCLKKYSAPIIATTDYMRLYVDQIRAFAPHSFHALGADGYGRSDTRKQLRHHFEVDAKHIAYFSLVALAQENKMTAKELTDAQKKLGIDPNKPFSLYE